MLELNEIIKEYPAGDRPVEALRGVSLRFRRSEFVSILGPSGCGKTTLLNIVGGLDQYTSGDLIINGKSTKDFKDRDWDTYRNHSIGFVFQTYNLIPHQTVLQNVEIALTVSGVSKVERRKRAIEALKQVGLGDQLRKRPNQISGGQMQRVAIARALVNDPDIILADEPTGALDTETGVQVLEIMKKVADDRLVIMVTHNPVLANRFSTRIIQMLDGKITSDSAPVTKSEASRPGEAKNIESERRPSMSFATAFMLSLKNLISKMGRSTLTAFAGSIGIMGIALILAVSQGTTNYIDTVQEDALSSYPLSIQETTVDLTTLMETFMSVGQAEISHDRDAIYKKTAIYDMVSAFNNLESNENDLQSFKVFLEKASLDDEEKGLAKAVTGLQYAYDLDLNVYTRDVDGDIVKSDTRKLMRDLMTEHMSVTLTPFTVLREDSTLAGMASMRDNMNSLSAGLVTMNLWQEILPGKKGEPINEVLKKQYDLVYGAWPDHYDEIVLVLDKNNELDDLTLYALGLEPKEYIDSIMEAALKGSDVQKTESKWSYEEIVDKEYRVILNSDSYHYDENSDVFVDLRKTEAGLKFLYDDALVLKVTGIIRPNEDAQSTVLSGAIGYTTDLTRYIVEQTQESSVIEAQRESTTRDVLNGLPFRASTGELSPEEKKHELVAYLSGLSADEKAEAYIKIRSIPPEAQVEAMVQANLSRFNRADLEPLILEGLSETMGVDGEILANYVATMSDEEMEELIVLSMTGRFKVQYAEQVEAQLGTLDSQRLAGLLDQEMTGYTEEEYEDYYDEIMVFSENTYEGNLTALGSVDLESPTIIRIFASSFQNKEVIEEAIKQYNEGKPELSQIKYTDYLGIMMSSITSIINAITYVLLAFVAISLIVSSIMIGVITLISVQERTKEIGILRAIGASKSDVSSMFNAETVIIGFASGLLGVVVTYLLCIPINRILHTVTGIGNLNAFLPVNAALVLVAISITLSVIAGFIPSRSAAKKDPVVALRTE